MKKPVTEEALQELRSYIQREVAAAFLTEAEIASGAADILSDDYDPGALAPHASRITSELVAAHKSKQASWPRITDCDRLDATFAELERAGVVCRQNFSCCGNCGVGEIRDEIAEAAKRGVSVRGYVFYHMQDTEAAVEGCGLYLNYGAVEKGEKASVGIGREITAALEREGLEVDWDGTWATRIGVSLDWKRRREE